MHGVSRETIERLALYEAALRKWSRSINLVAPEDLDQITARHFADSLQIAPHVVGESLADLGSGGGFPGLVLAAANPSLPVNLIESDTRKATFLRTAAREMKLQNVTVLAERIEAAPPQNAACVTARALAPLPRLLGYVNRHLRPGGTALLMKGAQWRTEVDAARQMWEFRCDAIPSVTDTNAAILHVTDLRPR